jgi:hypothetical protein
MKVRNKVAEQIAAKQKHREQLKSKRRKEPSLERSAARLQEKPIILIVCEGERTEPSYFNQFRIASATIIAVGEGINTVSLVNRALEFANQGGYDRVWCVFDKDDFKEEDFNAAIQLAEANNLGVAYSNQSFEYWLLLHFNDHQGGGMHRSSYRQKINELLKALGVFYGDNGSKIITEDFFEFLQGFDHKTGKKRVDLAILRAERNYNKLAHINPAREESSTTVFRLVRALMNYV